MAARRTSTSLTIRRLQRALLAVERDRSRPERELRRRAETVLGALAEIPAAILIANNGGQFVDANHAATVLTGFTHRELVRMSVWDLTPALRQGLGRRLWREFLIRERMSGTYHLKRKDGRVARPTYLAVANVLPGIHVSALVTARLARSAAVKRR